jgi:hypothetical protein
MNKSHRDEILVAKLTILHDRADYAIEIEGGKQHGTKIGVPLYSLRESISGRVTNKFRIFVELAIR